jgi:hypothetical protein
MPVYASLTRSRVDGDAAMALVREHRLLDAVTDEIPAFIMIRVSQEQMESATKFELEEFRGIVR